MCSWFILLSWVRVIATYDAYYIAKKTQVNDEEQVR